MKLLVLSRESIEKNECLNFSDRMIEWYLDKSHNSLEEVPQKPLLTWLAIIDEFVHLFRDE